MEHTEDHFHLGVKALIQNPKGELLLLQLVPRAGSLEPRWDLPGGRVKKNESLDAALKREVFEETGLRLSHSITPFLMMPTEYRIPVGTDTVGLILSIYHYAAQEEQPVELSFEHVHFEWVEPKRAAALLPKSFYSALIEKLKSDSFCQEILSGSALE